MFPSSLAAVLAAVAIQQELAAQDVPVRIGVHVGEVIVEPERLTGEAVNIAARIESFAVPGGVMLSDAAYDQIKNRSDVARRRARAVQAQERRAAVRALRRLSRRHRRAGSRVRWRERASGCASLPSNLPDRRRAAGRAGATTWRRSSSSCASTGSSRSPGRAGSGRRASSSELGRRLAPEFLDGVAFVPMADVTEAEDFAAGPCRSTRREGGRGADARRGHRGADRRQEGAPAPRQPRAGRRCRSGGGAARRALPGASDRDDEQDAAPDRRRA